MNMKLGRSPDISASAPSGQIYRNLDGVVCKYAPFAEGSPESVASARIGFRVATRSVRGRDDASGALAPGPAVALAAAPRLPWTAVGALIAANGDNGGASRFIPPVNIADLRREYHRAALAEADVDADPLRQFNRWLSEAVRAELPEPTAMTLATADAEGRPSARIVLLKGADADGFVFYTNYASRKGDELAVRPQAALLFHWVELERQVRIEGTVAKVAAAESDAYFATRPLLSRLGAWASPQSREIPDRGWLEHEFAAAQRHVAADGTSVPRPAHWGGYRLMPEALEFWQGRRSRLHDRLRYSREAANWRLTRLAP